MTIIEPTRQADLEAYYDLRWRILREPWGQPRGSERDEFEGDARHVAVFDADGRLTGVGRLHLRGPGEAQIRYMAVAEDGRRQGVGKAIVERLETIARSLDVATVVLNAREPAVPFYRAMGYEVEGSAPTLFGEVRHFRMRKDLA